MLQNIQVELITIFLCVFTDFSFTRAHDTINSDLSNSLGNLLSRITSRKVNPRQTVPALDEQVLHQVLDEDDKNMLRRCDVIADVVDRHFEDFSIDLATQCVFELVHWANALLAKTEPWKLVKSSDPRDKLECDGVVRTCCDVTRRCAILLQPIVPEMSERVLRRLAVPASRCAWQDASCEFYARDAETKLGRDEGASFQRLKLLSPEH